MALILVALSGSASVTAAEQFWWLAPSLSAASLVAVLWVQWARPAVRAHRMKRPFEAFLTISPDSPDGMTHELHVPPNRDIELQLRIYPHLTYTQYELVFGFTGKPDDVPQIKNTIDTFVARGKQREESPESTPEHYVDRHGRYHIKRTAERSKPNCHTIGYLICTRRPGRYPILLEAITDSGEAHPLHPLTLIVENRTVGSTPRD